MIDSNPIPKSDFWDTKSLGELSDYMKLLSGPEKTLGYHIMMLTLNTCHAMVQKNIES